MDVRRCIMHRLVSAIEADFPNDHMRQSTTLSHLEHLVAALASLPERQQRAFSEGLAEATRTPRRAPAVFRDEPDWSLDEELNR